MGKLWQWLRALAWPSKLLAVALAAGLPVWLKMLASAKAALALVVLFGVTAAWAAALAALLIAIGAGIELARRRPSSLLQAGAVPLTMVLCGGGFLVAMAPLLALDFNQGTLTVSLTGGLLFGFGLWRLRRPYERVFYPLMHLALVMLAFSAPREAGFFFLRWSANHTSARWSWVGGQNCNTQGTAPRRPLRIATLHPPTVILDRGLRGDLGRAIARKLSSTSPPGRGIARVWLDGRLEFGDVGCYLPFFRSERASGRVELNVALSGQRGGMRYTCSAAHSLSYKLDVTLKGIGACRDLRDIAARQLIAQIRAKVRALTGH